MNGDPFIRPSVLTRLPTKLIFQVSPEFSDHCATTSLEIAHVRKRVAPLPLLNSGRKSSHLIIDSGPAVDGTGTIISSGVPTKTSDCLVDIVKSRNASLHSHLPESHIRPHIKTRSSCRQSTLSMMSFHPTLVSTPQRSDHPTLVSTPQWSDHPTLVSTPQWSDHPTLVSTPQRSDHPTLMSTPKRSDHPTLVSTPQRSDHTRAMFKGPATPPPQYICTAHSYLENTSISAHLPTPPSHIHDSSHKDDLDMTVLASETPPTKTPQRETCSDVTNTICETPLTKTN